MDGHFSILHGGFGGQVNRQMIKIHKDKPSLLNRGNLRDLLIFLCAASAFVFHADPARIMVSFAALTIGCILHFIAKGVLVRDVILCKEGVYGIVRHPYYLANFLIDSSFCFLSGNDYLLFLYPFLFFWAYGPALKKEESRLVSAYGDEYVRYSLATPQIFPHIFSIKNLQKIVSGFSADRITTNELSRIARFWSVAFLILLLHDIGEEGVRELQIMANPRDYDGFVYLLLFVTLFMINYLFRMKGGKAC